MPSAMNPFKAALRKEIKAAVRALSAERKRLQSEVIAKKVLSSEAFKGAKRISIYLSTSDEVDTIDILREMFRLGKHIFVPTYKGELMEMVRLHGMDDYEGLPLTKWNIKQPNFEECRENVLDKGGLDLCILPGVAFTLDGGRLGHGRGYYDCYLIRHFEKYPNKFAPAGNISEKLAAKKTILVGLALKEQIVDKGKLPLEPHDFPLDAVFTSD